MLKTLLSKLKIPYRCLALGLAMLGLLSMGGWYGWAQYRTAAAQEYELHAALTAYWQTMSTTNDPALLAQVATGTALAHLQRRAELGEYPPPAKAIRAVHLREYGVVCGRVEVTLVYAGIVAGDPASWHSVVFLREAGVWKVALVEPYGVTKTDWQVTQPQQTCAKLGY